VGKAVQRARAKRRLRELFRQHQEKLPEPVDLMLISRAAMLTCEYAELERRFVQACEKIGREASRILQTRNPVAGG
jgi:ribonuclease P protein component